MFILSLLTPLLHFVTFCAASMKNNNSSLMIPGLKGQNGNNMDTAGFSEGDLLLQVRENTHSDTTCTCMDWLSCLQQAAYTVTFTCI